MPTLQVPFQRGRGEVGCQFKLVGNRGEGNAFKDNSLIILGWTWTSGKKYTVQFLIVLGEVDKKDNHCQIAKQFEYFDELPFLGDELLYL